MIFLHRMLQKDATNNSLHFLRYMDKNEYGWAKKVREKLTQYELCTDWDIIRMKSASQWKREMSLATESKNLETLIEACHKISGGRKEEKQKTKSIVECLNNPEFCCVQD